MLFFNADLPIRIITSGWSEVFSYLRYLDKSLTSIIWYTCTFYRCYDQRKTIFKPRITFYDALCIKLEMPIFRYIKYIIHSLRALRSVFTFSTYRAKIIHVYVWTEREERRRSLSCSIDVFRRGYSQFSPQRSVSRNRLSMIETRLKDRPHM